MRRTYIDKIAEYYRRKDDELDLTMGAFPGSFQSSVGRLEREMVPRSRYRREGLRIDLRQGPLLVVDDEARIRSTYQRIFAQQGFRVLTAASAVDARDILMREKIGILFLDINMIEVGGEDLFELVRMFHPQVKVIVSSVYPIEDQRERIKNADAYFDKADGKESLLKLVSSMVQGNNGFYCY